MKTLNNIILKKGFVKISALSAGNQVFKYLYNNQNILNVEYLPNSIIKVSLKTECNFTK